jgi:hypothetical protein
MKKKVSVAYYMVLMQRLSGGTKERSEKLWSSYAAFGPGIETVTF